MDLPDVVAQLKENHPPKKRGNLLVIGLCYITQYVRSNMP
jgi:hypothetical protein